MRYTNLYLFLLFGIVFSACDPESSTPTLPDDPRLEDGHHISLTKLKDHLPENYLQSGGFAVYTDDAGNEKRLEITYKDTIREQTEFGVFYTSDLFIVNLRNLDDLTEVRLSVSVAGGLSSASEEWTTFTAWLMPNVPQYAFALSIEFEENEPVITPYTLFQEVVELNGSTYYNVFFSGTNPTLTAYSELTFNTTEGIVSFYDGENKLWTFHRFE